jgi:Tol biopolymer transport system component
MKTQKILILSIMLTLALFYQTGIPIQALAKSQVDNPVRISASYNGEEEDGFSGAPVLSSSGRYVAFESFASNLVPNDTNNYCDENGMTGGDQNCFDIFVYDRQAGKMSRVSVSSEGAEAQGASRHPSISADGRYVAYHSDASNLVQDDTNTKTDVFVYDRQTSTTTLVSKSSAGVLGDGNSGSGLIPATNGLTISGDGRYVAFQSEAKNLVADDLNSDTDIFIHDRMTGTTRRVTAGHDGSQANGDSSKPVFSQDGRYLAFSSSASNLVPDDNNGKADIFVYDRVTGNTELVSKSTTGNPGDQSSTGRPALSSDGRYVAFGSSASNLVPGDKNFFSDVFLHDRGTGETILISVHTDGTQGNHFSGMYSAPAISGDGKLVAFESWASNLVDDDDNSMPDIFLHQWGETRKTTRISLKADGSESRGHEMHPAFSSNGRYVAFDSNWFLTEDDDNLWGDVYLYDLGPVPWTTTHFLYLPLIANGP